MKAEQAGNNGVSKKRQDTADRIIKALGECQGLLTMAARRAGVSYTTINRYVHDFPSVAQAVHEAKESLLDFAEGKLFTAMKEGNMTAIIFYLKTQGKIRGYIERQELTGANSAPVKVEISVVSERAKQLTEEIIKGYEENT